MTRSLINKFDDATLVFFAVCFLALSALSAYSAISAYEMIQLAQTQPNHILSDTTTWAFSVMDKQVTFFGALAIISFLAGIIYGVAGMRRISA